MIKYILLLLLTGCDLVDSVDEFIHPEGERDTIIVPSFTFGDKVDTLEVKNDSASRE